MTDQPINGGTTGADGQTSVAPTARPRDGFIKPKHGRGLLAPQWSKGQSGNPGHKRGEWHEARSICAKADADAARKLVQLLNSPDDRVAFMAAKEIIERNHGKVSEGPTPPVKPDLAGMGIDLRKLSTDELKSLAALIGRARGESSSDGSAETSSALPHGQVVDGAAISE
jgi:hypothetical protein